MFGTTVIPNAIRGTARSRQGAQDSGCAGTDAASDGAIGGSCFVRSYRKSATTDVPRHTRPRQFLAAHWSFSTARCSSRA